VAAPVDLVEVSEAGVDRLNPAARGSKDLTGERRETDNASTSLQEGMHALLHAGLSRLDEGEKLRVDLILMRCCEAMRSARVVDFLGALDEPGRLLG
jgi:hypothetical protein